VTIRTLARHPFAPLYVAAAGVVLLAASVGISSSLPAEPAPKPTQTTIPLEYIAPCALWENMQVPDLPADTYTDRCVDPDGVIAYADPEDVPS
jgi:hypothetical protein